MSGVSHMYLHNKAKPRLLMAASAALVAFALAGCATDDLALDDTYQPYAPSERYPIEYSKAPVTIQVATTSGTLQPSQVNAIAGFARQSLAGGATPVTIRRPAGGGKSARVAQEIAGLLVQQGVPSHLIRKGTYPAGSGSPVQISYAKAYAHTKPCGEWDENLANTAQNTRYSNHGCAVQSNIAAMIADPNDIVRPRSESMGEGSASVAAVTKVTTGEAPQQRSIFDIFR